MKKRIIGTIAAVGALLFGVTSTASATDYGWSPWNGNTMGNCGPTTTVAGDVYVQACIDHGWDWYYNVDVEYPVLHVVSHNTTERIYASLWWNFNGTHYGQGDNDCLDAVVPSDPGWACEAQGEPAYNHANAYYQAQGFIIVNDQVFSPTIYSQSVQFWK